LRQMRPQATQIRQCQACHDAVQRQAHAPTAPPGCISSTNAPLGPGLTCGTLISDLTPPASDIAAGAKCYTAKVGLCCSRDRRGGAMCCWISACALVLSVFWKPKLIDGKEGEKPANDERFVSMTGPTSKPLSSQTAVEGRRSLTYIESTVSIGFRFIRES
jgi:hypothetical protein